MNENKQIKENFFKYRRYLESVSLNISKWSEVINNNKLKSTASRVTVPRAFDPYVQYIEKSTKRPFPRELQFTVDEVKSQDKIMIDLFSIEKLDPKKIKLDYLFQAARQASTDVGLFGKSVHTLLDPEESAIRYPNNTSAGYPFFKRKDNPHVREDAISWCTNFMDSCSFSQIMKQPTAVFHRFQYKVSIVEDDYLIKKKIRPVWGVPYRILVFEGVLFRNIVDNYDKITKNNPLPVSCVGRTKKQVSEDIIQRLRDYKKTIVSLDYTKFDSTVPTFLWALFYACVKEAIKLDNLTDEHLKLMMAYHAYTPFCWNSTKIQFQRRGVPSGSLITSFFDTWVNRVLIHYSCLESSNGRHTAGSTCVNQGDDGVFVPIYTSLNHLINVSERFGMILDRENCSEVSYDEIFPFLGYIWDTSNRPTQVEGWYIAHLCLPSRFLKVEDIPLDILQTYRGISICMGLYQGMDWFEYLVGHSDRVWIRLKQEYANGQDPIINYVGEDQRLVKLRIPLSLIYNEGWEAF